MRGVLKKFAISSRYGVGRAKKVTPSGEFALAELFLLLPRLTACNGGGGAPASLAQA